MFLVAEGESVVGTCDLPMDAGSYCSGWHEYWYYDSDHSRCRIFYYGGCEGNDNRFATEEECASNCIVPGHASTTGIANDSVLQKHRFYGLWTKGSKVIWANHLDRCSNIT